MQTLYKDEARYVDAYLSEFEGYHSLGDAGIVDEDGYVHVMARTDDVINVAGRGLGLAPPTRRARPPRPSRTAGHRLSTGQLEEVVSAHPSVAECAVVGADDALKGQVPVALLVLTNDAVADGVASAAVVDAVVGAVRAQVGAVASFRVAAVADALPKTRSGKTLRGIIQAIANGATYTLPGTIEDVAPVESVRKALASVGYPPQQEA